MALATRNLYLILKARDEASRVIKGFGRELSVTGKQAQAQQMRAMAAMAEQKAMNLSMVATAVQAEARQTMMARQREIAAIRAKAVQASERAAAVKATPRQIETARNQAKELRAQATARTAELAVMRAANKKVNDETQQTIDKQRQLAKQFRAGASDLERSHTSSIRLANALHQVSATLVTVGSGFAVAGGAGIFLLYESTKAAAEYARQVSLTATQVDGFKVSLSQLSDVGLKVARTIAVPFQEIQPALYDIFSSTTANLAQATIMLEAFAKTAVAGQVSLEDATRGTIPILNAFNLPMEQVNRILDIQFQLVRKGVGTYGEFATVFGRVVPSATRAGQSFEEVAAGLAYLTRNGLSAAMASTSFARALDAISNPKSVNNMEQLGIKVRDVKGNMLPLEQILAGLQKHLLSLPNADRVAALVDIFKGAGGTIQARRFLDQVLLRPGELDEFIGFLGDMKNSTGQFGLAYDKMSNTVAAQTQLLSNKFKVFEVTIGQAVTPIFIVVLKYLNKILDAFNNLSPATQKWVGIGIAIASVFFIAAGAMLIFIGVLAGFAAAIITAGAGFFYLVGGVIALVTGLAVLGAMFAAAMVRSKGFRDMVAYVGTTVQFLWNNIIVPFAKDVAHKFDRDLLPPIRRFADVFRQKVLPQLIQFQLFLTQEIMPRIRELANWVKDRLGEAFKAVGWAIDHILKPTLSWLSDWYQAHKITIDQIVDKIIWFATQYGKYLLIVLGVLIVVFAGPIVGIIIAFVAVLIGVVMAVIWIVEVVKNVIRWFSNFGDHMQWLGNHIGSLFTNIGAWFTSLPAKIIAAIGDLGGTLIHAGEQLIMGLIKGVTNKLPSLGSIAHGAVALFKSFFPASPAKRGPLAGRGSMFYSGQKLIEQLNAGIASQRVALGTTASGAALNAAGSMLNAPRGGSGSVEQTFNISTQEINPRQHSAELGFLLAARG